MKNSFATSFGAAVATCVLGIAWNPAWGAEVSIQPGDVNGDGKVNAKDFALLYKILYRDYKAPLENVAAMDVNGDGVVDVSDMVALSTAIGERKLPPRRPAPAVAPAVVPRYADYLWNVPARRKLAADIKNRQSRIFGAVWDGELEEYPDRELTEELDELTREVDYALHYGMLADPAKTCADLALVTSDVRLAKQRRDAWLAERPEGRSYLGRCAASGPTVSRKVMSIWVDWRCSKLGGLVPQEGGQYSYFIDRSGGKLTLRVPFTVEFDQAMSYGHKLRFQALWTKAVNCAQAYWSRYGVEFKLEQRNGADATFTVYADDRRSNSWRFSMGDLEYDACGLLLHESGHWLGLADQYDEKGWSCSGRRNARDDIMTTGGNGNAGGLRFYSRDLQRIFGPVCGRFEGGA